MSLSTCRMPLYDEIMPLAQVKKRLKISRFTAAQLALQAETISKFYSAHNVYMHLEYIFIVVSNKKCYKK